LRGIDNRVQVRVEERMAIVSLVGEGITIDEQIAARMRNALRGSDVRLLAQGSSALSISVAVADGGLADAVEALHREFFQRADAEIFADTPESERQVAQAVTARSKVAAGLALADAQS
jgi:hypothetical protein